MSAASTTPTTTATTATTATTTTATTTATATTTKDVSKEDDVVIEGMTYHKDVIDQKTESALLAFLYGPFGKPRAWQDGPGGGSRSRRVQQYGYAYDYASLSITSAPPIPDELQRLISELQQKGLLNKHVNQIIVNEYKPGQGITPHVDHVKWFGEEVASLTLQSGCKMILSNPSKSINQSIYLDRKSLIRLTGLARWHFLHSIAATKSDPIKNTQTNQINMKPRGTRVSITFRQVVRTK
jgi:alkylated DNA repair dioxygenase AlkB